MKRQKDINYAGGAIRPIMKRHRGQYDAGYELLDMSTGKPHTNQSLKAALEVRKNEYPEMTQMIEAVLAGELTKKAEHHPTAVYKLSRRATTEEAARASAEKMLFPPRRGNRAVIVSPTVGVQSGGWPRNSSGICAIHGRQAVHRRCGRYTGTSHGECASSDRSGHRRHPPCRS